MHWTSGKWEANGRYGIRYDQVSREFAKIDTVESSTHLFNIHSRNVIMEIDEENFVCHRCAYISGSPFDSTEIAFGRLLMVSNRTLTESAYSGWLHEPKDKSDLDNNFCHVATHPTKDLAFACYMATINDQVRLAVEMFRFSDHRRLGHIVLDEFPAFEDSFIVPSLFEYDEKSQRILLGVEDRFFSIDVSAVEEKATPFVMLGSPFRVHTQVGEASVIPVQLNNPTINNSFAARLASNDLNATLRDNRIRFSPTMADLGSHLLKLQVEVMGERHDFEIRVDVTLPFVNLRGHSNPQFVLSRSGDLLAIFGKKLHDQHDQYRFLGFSHKEIFGQVDIFDVEKGRMVASVNIGEILDHVWVEGRYLLATLKKNRQKQLAIVSLDETSTIWFLDLPDDLIDITPNDPQSVIIHCGKESPSQHFLDLENAKFMDKEVDIPPLTKKAFRMEHGVAQVDNRIVDFSSMKTRCVVDWISYPNLLPSPSVSGSRGHVKLWARFNNNFDSDESISLAHPVRANVDLRDGRYYFDLSGINSGLTQLSIPYDDTNPRRGSIYFSQHLAFAKDYLLILHFDRLYKFLLPNEFRSQEEVLTLNYPNMPVVNLTETTTLDFDSIGGVEPVKFFLDQESEGVAIEAETGVLTVNGPRLLGHVLRKINDQLKNFPIGDPERGKLAEFLTNPGDRKQLEKEYGLQLDSEGSLTHVKLNLRLEDGNINSFHRTICMVTLLPEANRRELVRQLASSKTVDIQAVLNEPDQTLLKPGSEDPKRLSKNNSFSLAGALNEIRNGILFTGNDIVETNTRINYRQPLLIETIFTPWDNSIEQTLVSNRILRIFIKDGLIQASVVGGGRTTVIQGEQPIVPGRTMHAAVYLDGQSIALFVNGKRQSMTKPVKRLHEEPRPICFGATPSGRKTNEHHFKGIIHGVRFRMPEKRLGDNVEVPVTWDVTDDTSKLWHWQEGIRRWVEESGDSARNLGWRKFEKQFAFRFNGIPPLQPVRNVWKSVSGDVEFIRASNGVWHKFVNGDELPKDSLVEQDRTFAYVQLFDNRLKMRLRLQSDSIVRLNPKLEWKKIYDGSWYPTKLP